MAKKIIKTENAPSPIGPYSQGIRVGNLFFVSGQGPIDPKTGKKVLGGIAEQTRQTLENIKSILEAAGLNLDNVVRTSVFLRDIKNFEAMNQVYSMFFNSNPPARTTIQAVPPGDTEIEIDVIAYIE